MAKFRTGPTMPWCSEFHKEVGPQRVKIGPVKQAKIKVKFSQIIFCNKDSPCIIDYQGGENL